MSLADRLGLFIDSRHQNGSFLTGPERASKVQGLPVISMEEALRLGLLDAKEGVVSLSVGQILAHSLESQRAA